jgi:RimJ/RimL family protein N-acetyltransferase
VGRALFTALIDAAKSRRGVSRLELFCREGNAGAIHLYQSLGFIIEGRLKGRVRLADGTIEDDLVMGLVI